MKTLGNGRQRQLRARRPATFRPQLENLEQRRLLAADLKIGPTFSSGQDQAEFSYFADGREIALEPIPGEVVIGAKAGSRLGLGSLLGKSGSWYENAQSFGGHLVTLETTADGDWTTILDRHLIPSLTGPLEAGFRESLWVAPAFRSAESGLRQWLSDEIIVSLQDDVDVTSFFADPTFVSYRPLRGTTDQFIATVAEGGGLEALRLANDVVPTKAGVRWATVNFISEGKNQLTPNDPLFVTQWNLNNFGQSGVTDADGDFAEAWDVTTGDSQVVIAIVDSGVQTNHPDINMWVNPGEIAGNGVDDDANGWIDDVNGINLADGNANSNDPNPSSANDRHGTAVAGVAGARGNNSLGVAGGAFGAKIMAIKPWIENAN
ncbi:MAG TPA: S8 family serine peptidase, partial [Pirellulaceae bacterium]